jgi:hypothetical protein
MNILILLVELLNRLNMTICGDKIHQTNLLREVYTVNKNNFHS